MKRLTAIILAAIILLSSFEPVVAAEKSTAESKKIKWMLENNFIVGRGQTKDLKLEDTITRAEFTRMILVAKGEENLAKEDSTSKADFKDVPNTHWAEKFIAYAKQKGYISGYPDGNFIPEGEITYEEIISILARIHPNYRKIEAKSTNWAEGYINFAKDNGILDDINIKGSYKSPAIREKTFEMTYNFIKFVENQTKSEKVSKIKEEKDVKKENSTWNGFYPYWLGYGFRPSEEEKPDVKPNPDVKPAPDKPDKPGKENPSEPGTEPETPKVFNENNITKIEVKDQPAKLEYTDGEKLDLSGIKLKLTDTQGIVKEADLGDFGEYGITTDPSQGDLLKTDHNNTKIKIKLNGVEKVETDPLIVKSKEFDPENAKSITVNTQPKLEYTEGEKLDLTGLVVTLTDNQGLTKDVAFADFAANGIEAAPANDTALTLTDNAKKVKLTKGNLTAETKALTVKAKVFDPDHVEKMVVKEQPTKLFYTEGEKLDLAGLEVTLTDNQGLTKDVAFKDFAANGITAAPANETALTLTDNAKKVKLTKGNLTAETEALTVLEKVVGPKDPTKPDGKNPDENKYWTVKFESADTSKGAVAAESAFYILKTVEKTLADLKDSAPAVTAIGNNKFDGWDPVLDTNTAIDQDRTIKAKFSAKEIDKNNITKIEVIAPPTKLNYVVGESLNLDGLKVKLTDNQGVTEEIGLTKFDDYKIKTEPEKNKSLTESDNNTKIIIKRENEEAITGNISLTLKVISKADFDKENEIKKSIKNSLVEVYKNLGDLKLGIDNIQNKYYLLFTKDANEIRFDKDSLKTSIINTIKTNKIKSYTIGESTRDLTKTDDEILGFIREDILKIAGIEGNQDANDAQILEQLKTTKPNTKIKLVAGDENISFDYEIIFLTQMAEEKLVDIENKFIKVMEETAKIVPQKKIDNYKLEVSYLDKHCTTKFSAYLLGEILSTSVAKGYKDALTGFLTGEMWGKTLTLSNLKSIFISTNEINKHTVKNGMMERYELEDLLPIKSSRFIYQTEQFHNTFQTNGKDMKVYGKPLDLFKHNTAVEYFYVDESNETGGIITRTIHFESIKN
ncbi:MAG: bacterial Ig-like domain-containing protein [Peptoniphilus duerdenii]|uniref:S-layer homology domain-containing protein n=1 Tax=Peptoniphilus duerdenii TaxID=507750 RepID=UPI002551056E|nr:bacterial Ig-like domain-containing protein [Peptoniphilus duerdenii]MDK8276322.1 bacterial Ig-like domain-containing protein [Peptoniphilus duerdenii]